MFPVQRTFSLQSPLCPQPSNKIDQGCPSERRSIRQLQAVPKDLIDAIFDSEYLVNTCYIPNAVGAVDTGDRGCPQPHLTYISEKITNRLQ